MMDDAMKLAPRRAADHPARGIVRRIYTANPFYVVSADLVFVGLRMSFDTSGKTFEAGALMLALAGYTLLLATTACVLVRLGQVWDDVRTILLVVVMMFLAISVTFDQALTSRPAFGLVCYLGGFLFAVVVSMGLLRGLRLRLPVVFRVPYYLILGLFFVYPVALIPVLRDPEGPALQWALFGFATIAGLVVLALLPAVRQGRRAVARQGSPWRYPWYPWTLFGLLGVCVCGRAYSLCISLHFVEKANSIFGLYFLVPFLFAVAVLLLEVGIVAKNRAVLRFVLLVPPALLWLAQTDQRPDRVYQGFLALFQQTLGGSPLYWTVMATVVFYGFAALRRVPVASEALSLAVLALAVVGPRTMDLGGLTAPNPLPIFLVAVQQGALALRSRDSWHTLTTAVWALTATRIVLGAWPDVATVSPNVIAFHLALIAALVIGACFHDVLAALLQHASAVAIVLACLTVVTGDPRLFGGIAPHWVRLYPVLLAAIAAGYGVWMGNRLFLAAAALGLGAWLIVVGWSGYLALRRAFIGLDQIVLGLISFVLAALISLRKAGVLPRKARRTSEG